MVSPPTYAEGTINPNIRRRKSKKKSLARDSFLFQVVETVDDEIPILPPQIKTPHEDLTIPDIPPQTESPTLSPTIKVPSIPPPVDLPPRNTFLSISDVGYKFLKFFQVTKTSGKVVIIREKLLR